MKRIFSLLLTIALMASLLAVPAFAESKTLTLTEDWRLTDELDLNVPEGTTLIIQGNGYHIYEFRGQLANSNLGKVVFDNTILYPSGISAACTPDTSNQLMMDRQPHAVTIDGSMVNGSVSITSGTSNVSGKAAAKKDDVITLTVTPNKNYQLNSLTYTATEISGSPTTITANAGTYSFTMPASDVTIAATFAEVGTPAAPAAPTFSPASGTYSSAQTVTMTAEEGVGIFYTTDGSEPNETSNPYDGPITISETTTLKAVAFYAGALSDVTTATYTISTGGGGGSSSSSGTTTETTTNPDGSITTTVTNTITGTVTTTTTDKDGNKTEVVKNSDGSSKTTVTSKDGSASTTTVSAAGRTESLVTLPDAVVNAAAETGEAVTLPMPAVTATADSASAPTVTVGLPGGARVEIPVENVTFGTIVVVVGEVGTERIVKTTVATENGVAVTLSDGDTVKIVDNTKTFSDVSDSYWGADAVTFATSRELFNGTSATTFSPDTPMNRAMIVTVLARLEGVDTDPGANWYDAGAAWAVGSGISDGSNLMGHLTREQLATMLYRYAQSKGYDTALGGMAVREFSDYGSISDYAAEAMTWAVDAGILNGVGGNRLDPQGQATRAQVATMLMRFIEYTAS